ncbi:MAG: hypothetical protein ACR2Q4_13625 [Geminicoccaceae bacterium]
MEIAARSSQQDEILQETASRLIDALGLEGAIFVCRSNYWHGVLRLIEARKHGAQTQRPQGKPSSACPNRLHSLPIAA